ncbi:MAG: hemolysin family protein [Acidobacteriota bacterium]|jgi:CBS domain containing-hemolysin-like protein
MTAGVIMLWAAAVFLAAAVVTSTLSALIDRAGPIRLRHWTEEADGRLRELYERPDRFEAFRLLLSTCAKLAPVGLLWSLASWLRGTGLTSSPAVAGLWAGAFLLVVVTVNEIANRYLVAWNPERVLEGLTGLYRALLVGLGPLLPVAVLLLPGEDARVRTEEDEEEATEDEIEAFIDVGTREGILEPGEGEMVWGIVDFGDTPVKSVMTPRIDVRCASADAGLDELAALFVESGHSRMPLYETSIDHIVGILHIRDLLKGLRSEERPTPRSLANPPFFVPETKPLGQLLKELQARFQQMAVVVDEYGGTAGIVTVEDLVEEIVGELVDEHEEAHPENELLADGAWLLAGSSDVDVLEDLFGIDLGEVPYGTVGGMVFSLLGDVPAVGQTVEGHGLRYTVEEVEERRVARVRVEPALTAGALDEPEETA